MKKNLLNLLDNIQEHGDETPQSERYLLIDGLNLFFRNFSAINAVNSNGVHIGGLGGFFRSLGALIRTIQPTQVYVVFDGAGSSNNRKNIIPEYKSARNITRVTKHELFDSLEEEDDSKVDQIVRIIQYLKTLPVKTISLPRVEADDIISYLAQQFAAKLLDEGIYVIGFFYPVVPKDKARIRVQLSAAHEKDHLDKALAAFEKVGKELGVIK